MNTLVRVLRAAALVAVCVAVCVNSAQAGPYKNSKRTETPIEHLIVVIGENRQLRQRLRHLTCLPIRPSRCGICSRSGSSIRPACRVRMPPSRLRIRRTDTTAWQLSPTGPALFRICLSRVRRSTHFRPCPASWRPSFSNLGRIPQESSFAPITRWNPPHRTFCRWAAPGNRFMESRSGLISSPLRIAGTPPISRRALLVGGRIATEFLSDSHLQERDHPDSVHRQCRRPGAPLLPDVAAE